jgi:hypothetical protein
MPSHVYVYGKEYISGYESYTTITEEVWGDHNPLPLLKQ